jgi:glycine/D-amino acid oxidase-like deaminating enzyme
MQATDHSSTTWYEATASRGPARPRLTGTVDADVCVIGGGLAGLTTALELARRGTGVVLLEGRQIAWGASGRNGGFVSSGFAVGQEAIAEKLGADAAAALYRLSVFGTEYVRREIAEGDASIKMGDGWLSVVRYDAGNAKAEAARAHFAAHGERRQVLSPAETRAQLASQRYFQGSLDPTAFHMHPLRYALMLAAKAEAAGARLFEASPAVAVARQGSGFQVRTPAGSVRARQVVYCVSALDRRLHGATGRAVLPVATYVAVTAPLRQAAIRTGHAVSDSRRAGNYFRLVDEGRILWGGAITTRVSEPKRLADDMLRDMVSTFPQLGRPRIDYAWAGLMGYARHMMPLIGTDGQGQWWATAFGGHGMNTTAMAGILLSRALAAGDDEYRRFAAYGPVWAGGPFGRVAVQLSYWSMQMRDLADERRSAAR